MKKKLFLGTFCMAIAIACAVCNSNSFASTSFAESNLLMENVEALSDGNESGKTDCKFNISRICTSGNKDHHFYRSL